MTPIYSTVTHTIPYENGYKLVKKDSSRAVLQKRDESGATADERITSFCETPRSKKEITRLLGMLLKNCTGVWRNYIEPLVTAGKLKMTIPTNRASKNQRFVSGDAVVPTAEAIIEFCGEPRTREEINKYFGLTSWTSWT